MKGFFLIEVVISLLVFSTLFLFFLHEKGALTKSISHNFYQHIAIQQVLSLIDRFTVNTSEEYRTNELKNWRAEVAASLPRTLTHVSYYMGKLAIKLCWQERTEQCVTHARQLQATH